MLSHLVLTHLQCTKSLVNSTQVQAVLKLLISRAVQRKILFLRHRTLLFADMGWIKTVPMERNLQLQCLLPFEQRLGVKVQRCVIFRSFHGRHKATNLDAWGIRITSYSPPKNTIQNLSFAALLVLQCEDLEINRTHSAEYRTSHSMKWSLTARMFHSNSHSVLKKSVPIWKKVVSLSSDPDPEGLLPNRTPLINLWAPKWLDYVWLPTYSDLQQWTAPRDVLLYWVLKSHGVVCLFRLCLAEGDLWLLG